MNLKFKYFVNNYHGKAGIMYVDASLSYHFVLRKMYNLSAKNGMLIQLKL